MKWQATGYKNEIDKRRAKIQNRDFTGIFLTLL
jgi:hypothetical protein